MKRNDGLTLLEVLASVVILGVVIALFSSVFIASLNQTRTTGSKLEATQLLNYFGRMAAGGATRELPFVFNSSQQPWNYGQLSRAFPELTSGSERVKDVNSYKVAVTAPQIIAVGTAEVIHYHVQVCWREGTEERCLEGDTAGPRPTAVDPDAFLPATN